MIDWFRGEIAFKHTPIPAGVVMSIDCDGTIEWEMVKSIPVRGSYESSLKIKSSGVLDENELCSTLLIDGNLSKFIQGHNIFGSLDLNLLLSQSFQKIINQHSEHFNGSEIEIKRTLNLISKGDYLVKMLDINFLFDVKNDESVESWLHACEMNARTRSGRSCRDKGTVYVQKTSRRWAFKFYNKYRECIKTKSKKHKLNNQLSGLGLEDFIKGKLRAELRLMSQELKDSCLTHGYHLTKSKLISLFYEYLGRITMNNQATLIDEQLIKLPRILQSTYQLWRQGASLKDILSKPTFYRHRKQLLEQGIDITMPPTHPEKSNNVIPLMRVIEATPVDIPQWAFDRGLVAA